MPVPFSQGRKTWCAERFLVASLALLAAAWIAPARAQSIVPDLEQGIRQRAAQIEAKLVAWRRDIHEHPELGEQETRTAAFVVAHLTGLGLEVKDGVAQAGVVALLKGGKPGPVVALRADMDALTVKEPEGLPFASRAKGKYLGREVDVMHACDHDAHTAILMATAEVLTAMRERLPGSVKFIFQPAEEGPSLYAAFTGKIWGRAVDGQGRRAAEPKARRGVRPARQFGPAERPPGLSRRRGDGERRRIARQGDRSPGPWRLSLAHSIR